METMKLSFVLLHFAMLLQLLFCSYTVVAAGVECEELAIEECAFAVSSTGARCVLEKQVSSSNSDPDYRCQTSLIMAERQVEWIETNECIDACGLQRLSVGLSTDAFLEPEFTTKFCFSDCRRKCANIDDLYTKLAAGEGIYLPSLCDALKKKAPRKLMVNAAAREEGRVAAEVNAGGAAAQQPQPPPTTFAAAPAPSAATVTFPVATAPSPSPFTPVAAAPSPSTFSAAAPSPTPSSNGNNDYYVQQGGAAPAPRPSTSITTTSPAPAPTTTLPSPSPSPSPATLYYSATPPTPLSPSPAPIGYSATPAPAPTDDSAATAPAIAVDYLAPGISPAVGF